jgi:uncharacterized membrane protein YqhA
MFRFALALRFLMLFASLGAVAGALIMFWRGGAKLFSALPLVIGGGDEANTTTALVMAATDAFLFGVVLMIFAYAITFGFVLDLADATRNRLPQWMRVEGVAELKHTLVQVILVYLVVDFATDVAEPAWNESWQALVKPISIFLVAGALRLMANSAERAGD